MIVQRLKKSNRDAYQLAETYYRLLSSLNSLDLTEREIQLVAHAAIHGNISNVEVKRGFCEKHNTSVQTVYNIVAKLLKMKVLIKENGKTKVNPIIVPKFDGALVLEITLLHG